MNILLIDDEEDVLESISEALDLIGFPSRKFNDPNLAVKAYIAGKFDVVVTDMKMPGMNGIDVLKAIRKHDAAARVICLTGYSDVNDAIGALNNGAYAFFRKPLNMENFLGTLFRIEEELESVREFTGIIRNIKELLSLSDSWEVETELYHRTGQSVASLENINSLLFDIQMQSDGYFTKSVEFMAKVIEARDRYTSGHVGRVTAYTLAVAGELGWDGKKMEEAYLGALLHDIGKIGVPDTILNKPGTLTDDEFEIVKTHVTIGVNMLEGLPRFSALSNYILSHHERYDGRGYPNGLGGGEIPIEGRIISVADSFDSMTSDRPYRKARGIEEAVAELRRCSGTQYDPEIVDAFLRALQLRDTGEDRAGGTGKTGDDSEGPARA